MGMHVVPQQTAYVVERFGKFHKILDAGFHLLMPVVDRVAYVHHLKEEAISVPSQTAITKDNVSITIDGILYVKVTDPYKASYGIEDPHYAVAQLAQTTMRSELGKISLDRTFQERDTLNANIVESINAAADPWGIQCMRYEIRDIVPPRAVRSAMELEAEAERRKRAMVLDSEGDRLAAVNAAEGAKVATVLRSEAAKQERINIAQAEAQAVLVAANASAEAVERLAAALSHGRGQDAMQMRLAEQYIKAFAGIAKETNTVVLPANAADAGSMVAGAMAAWRGMQPGGQARSAAPVDGAAVGDLNGEQWLANSLSPDAADAGMGGSGYSGGGPSGLAGGEGDRNADAPSG